MAFFPLNGYDEEFCLSLHSPMGRTPLSVRKCHTF